MGNSTVFENYVKYYIPKISVTLKLVLYRKENRKEQEEKIIQLLTAKESQLDYNC